MSPYKHNPRRHFSNKMFSPYFQTNHYQEEHGQFEVKIEKLFTLTVKGIIDRIKRLCRIK